MQETARKLSGLLDTMLQHSKAIDELQRAAMMDPITRVHEHVADLGSGMRKRLMVDLWAKHGSATFVQLDEEERLDVLRDAMLGLPYSDRVRLLCCLAGSEPLAGPLGKVIADMMASQRTDTASQVLHQVVTMHEARLRDPSERVAFREALCRNGALPQTGHHTRASTLSRIAASPSNARTVRSLQSHHKHADLLAKCAVDVGPEATAGLPQALLMMDERERNYEHGKPETLPDSEALLLLLHAMEQRCASARAVERELRAQIQQLNGKLAQRADAPDRN